MRVVVAGKRKEVCCGGAKRGPTSGSSKKGRAVLPFSLLCADHPNMAHDRVFLHSSTPGMCVRNKFDMSACMEKRFLKWKKTPARESCSDVFGSRTVTSYVPVIQCAHKPESNSKAERVRLKPTRMNREEHTQEYCSKRQSKVECLKFKTGAVSGVNLTYQVGEGKDVFCLPSRSGSHSTLLIETQQVLSKVVTKQSQRHSVGHLFD
mmetsp:Transcript_2444/g.9201  ORF Transcript_2444/g.9201 Transcript_2444/m.9201 type:complete len:207 (+) Transcript_2444:856-1476(+)